MELSEIINSESLLLNKQDVINSVSGTCNQPEQISGRNPEANNMPRTPRVDDTLYLNDSVFVELKSAYGDGAFSPSHGGSVSSVDTDEIFPFNVHNSSNLVKLLDHPRIIVVQGFAIKIDNHYDNLFAFQIIPDPVGVPEWIWAGMINACARLGVRVMHPELLDLFYFSHPINFHRTATFRVDYNVVDDFASINIWTNIRYDANIDCKGGEINFFHDPFDPDEISRGLIRKYANGRTLQKVFDSQRVKFSYLNHRRRFIKYFTTFTQLMIGVSPTSYQIENCIMQHFNIDRTTAPDFLVGIETNPGPKRYDDLVAYLRNVERMPQSQQRCVRTKSVSNEIVRAARDAERDRCKLLSLKRRCKRFFPEAGILGLDKESLEAIKEVKEVFSKFVDKGLPVNVSTNLGIKDTISEVFGMFDNAILGFIGELLNLLKWCYRTCRDLLSDILNLLWSWVQPKLDDGLKFIFEFILKYVLQIEIDFEQSTTLDFKVKPESGLGLLSLAIHYPRLQTFISERSFSSFERLLSSATKTSNLLHKPWVLIIEYFSVALKMLGQVLNYDVSSFLGMGDIVDVYWTRYQALRKEFYNGVTSGFNFTAAVMALQIEIEHSYNKCKEHDLKNKFEYLLRGVRELTMWAQSNFSLSGHMRPEPLGILLTGPTNVGKSTWLHTIIVNILANTLSDEELTRFIKTQSEFIYTRNAGMKHWDGYTMNSKVVVYDDFGQSRDVAGAVESEAKEIISAINTAPWPLPMAELSDKGKFFFTASFVIGNTNMPRLHFDSINCDNAVVRRFKVAFCQVPRVEWCTDLNSHEPFNRKIDFAKVRKHFGECDPSKPESYAFKDIYEFIEWDFDAGAPRIGGKNLSFDEFIAHVVTSSKESSAKSDHLMSFMDKNLKDALVNAGRSNIASLVGKIKPAKSFEDHPTTPLKYSPESGFFQFFSSNTAAQHEEDVDYVTASDGSQSDFDDELKLALERADKHFSQYWILDPFRNFSSEFRSRMSKSALAVAGVLATLGAVFAYFWSKAVQIGSIAEQSGEARDALKPSKKHEKNNAHTKNSGWSGARFQKNKVRQWLYDDFGPEAGDGDPKTCPAADFLMSLMKKNVYLMSSGDYTFGYATFIKGRTFVIPLHFLEKWKFSEEMSGKTFCVDFVNTLTKQVCFSITKDDMYFLSGREDLNVATPDYCFVRLKDYVCREHRDITSFFPSQKPSTLIGDKRKFVMRVERSNMGHILQGHYSLGQTETYKGDCGAKYCNNQLWYSVETSNADCGALLVSVDNRTQKPQIVGFHVAGGRSGAMHSKVCLGVYLQQQFLKDVLDELNEDSAVVEDEISIDFTPELGHFPAIRAGPNVAVPRHTKLQRSEISTFLPWPTTKAPAALLPFVNDAGGVVDPQIKARDKYFFKPVVCPPQIHSVFERVSQLVLRTVVPAPWAPRLFSYEEAVCGIPGVNFTDGVKRSTSPGFPYILTNTKQGKSYWMGIDGPYEMCSGPALELRKDVEVLLDKAKRGIRSEIVYIDYLKDELRTLDRVASGSTRQFMSCPMHFLIAVKMYFGDFARSYCENNKYNGGTIGLDCVSDWDVLYRVLMPNRDRYVIAGDYKSFDAKLPQFVSLKVLDIVERFYSNASAEDRRVRRVLYQEIINSRHLSNGVIYEFCGGIPSGHPLTAIVNSIANTLMIYSTFEYIQENLAISGPLLEEIKVVTNGDDHVISIPNDYPITHEHVAEAMKSLWNYEYTDESKGQGYVGKRAIEDVQYLKRGFSKIGGHFVCPISLETLLNTVHWCRKGFTHREFLLRIEECFLEFSMHGKDVFEQYVPHILLAYQKCYPEQNVRYTQWKDAFQALCQLRI